MTPEIKALMIRLRAAMREEDEVRAALAAQGLDTTEKLQDAMEELVNDLASSN
jgi:hypothetical protein